MLYTGPLCSLTVTLWFHIQALEIGEVQRVQRTCSMLPSVRDLLATQPSSPALAELLEPAAGTFAFRGCFPALEGKAEAGSLRPEASLSWMFMSPNREALAKMVFRKPESFFHLSAFCVLILIVVGRYSFICTSYSAIDFDPTENGVNFFVSATLVHALSYPL